MAAAIDRQGAAPAAGRDAFRLPVVIYVPSGTQRRTITCGSRCSLRRSPC
jgi:hypothetical protein